MNAILRGTIGQIALAFNGDINDRKMRDKLAKKRSAADTAIAKNIENIERTQANENWSSTKKARKIREYQKRINNLRAEKKAATMPKDNLVVATFSYPRSGHSNVMTTRPLDIPSDSTVPVEPGQDFFDAGLFKEEIQSETELQISITDKDKANGFLTFLRAVISSALNAVTGDAIEGISEVLVSKTAAETSNLIEKAVKGDGKDKIETVAQSKKVKVRITDGGELEVLNEDDTDITVNGNQLRLTLRTPKDLRIGEQSTSNVKPTEPVYLRKGERNGFISLDLSIGAL